jgi:hypothetical protein
MMIGTTGTKEICRYTRAQLGWLPMIMVAYQSGNGKRAWHGVHEAPDKDGGKPYFQRLNLSYGYCGDTAGALSSAPSLVVYNHQLYCFHQGAGEDKKLYFDSYETTCWSGRTEVSGVTLASGPSAVVYKGQLYVFYRNTKAELMYGVFDGKSWTTDLRVPGAYAKDSPSAVAYDKEGLLCVFYPGNRDGADGKLWYNVYDGTKWERQDENKPAGAKSWLTYAPSVIQFKETLYVFFKGASHDNKNLYYVTYQNGAWSSEPILAQSNCTDNAPAAVPYTSLDGSEYICVFFQKAGKSTFIYSADGSSWTRGDLAEFTIYDGPGALSWIP